MSLSIKQIQERLFQTILERSSQAIVFVDDQARIKIWNRAAERLFGIPAQQAVGQVFFHLVLPPDDIERAQEVFRHNALEAHPGNHSPVFSEVQVRLANGMKIWTDQAVHHFVIEDDRWAFLEIRDAESRKRRESELERAATTDELSQLVNRRGFQAMLESHLQQRLLLAIIDVDRFKDINDTLGHESGDEAIRFIAQRLSEFFPEAICVSRLGGDEFGVLMRNRDPLEAKQIFEGCRHDVETNSRSSFPMGITVSIGVAFALQPSTPARELLKTADRAMYLSKHGGRNRVTTLRV